MALGGGQLREGLAVDQHSDAARDTWLSCDQPGLLERGDHLVNDWRADAKEPLHIRFGRRPAEHQRVGMANLFVFLDAHRSWRHVKVTDHRTARDFAHCMRDLVDVHYPQAALTRVVLDDLSMHTAGALYETFPAPEAHRVLQRLEFHCTPKHASWLNMAEIEIGVLRGQCLDRRIGERNRLVTELNAWQQQRNASGARTKWMFTTERARSKLARAYPDTAKEP